MPYMNVIPPGLDFSNLKVDLPEDPVIKEMQQHKPAYGGVSTPKAPQDSPKSGGGRTPKSMSESSKRRLLPSQLVSQDADETQLQACFSVCGRLLLSMHTAHAHGSC